MKDKLPKWDIAPSLERTEMIPIAESPDEAWCDVVNFMFADRGYRLQVFADHYSAVKMSDDGLNPTQNYELRELTDDNGEPIDRYMIGIFTGIEMRPDWRPNSGLGPIHKQAFARLVDARDVEGGGELTLPNQHVMIPVTRTQELWFEQNC